MQFLQRQQAAQQRTRLLRLQFALVLIPASALSLATCMLQGYCLTWLELRTAQLAGLFDFPPGRTALLTGACIHAIVFLNCFIRLKRRNVRDTGEQLAESLDNRQLENSTRDASYRKLANVVEEMSLAAGIPAPRVHVWQRYRAINSVTLGQSPADARIFVTQFAVDGLTRSELQALVAYSMSQILNGDIALNTRVASYVQAFGLDFREDSSRSTSFVRAILYWMFIGLWLSLVFPMLGWPPYLAAKYLQARIGRERQRLGDASVIQFTRDQDSFVSLLTKALAFPVSVKLTTGLASLHGEFAHCCFVSPEQRRFLGIQDPLRKRLKAIDPRIQVPDPDSPTLDALRADVRRQVSESENARYGVLQTTAPPAPAPGPPQTTVEPDAVVRQSSASGTETPARGLRMDKTSAAICALLMDRNPRVRARQTQVLGQYFAPDSLSALDEPLAELGYLMPTQRTLALDQRLPGLRAMAPENLALLREALGAITKADNDMDFFEFALSSSVGLFIDDFTRPRAPHGTLTFDAVWKELCTLFNALASFTSAERAALAYESGMRALNLTSYWPYRQYKQPQSWSSLLSEVLPRLDSLTPIAKAALLEALGKTAHYDGENSMGEREVLRAVAACLHCPLPRAAVV